MRVCLAPSRVLGYTNLGGHAWVYANWTLGLQAAGCEVVWLERCGPDDGPATVLSSLDHLAGQLEEIGVDVDLSLVLSPDDRRRLAEIETELTRRTLPLEEVASRSDLLLNFYYELEPEILAMFRRTALMDIDPGLLQIWMRDGDLEVAPHDLYFTTGETVGQPGNDLPDCDLTWIYTPPLVHLEPWPVRRADPGSSYTTVSSWWADWEVLDGEPYSNEKRTSFLPYIELPRRTGIPLELALCLSSTEEDRRERQGLESSGWSIRDANRRCDTPARYRDYLQRSRGEFSCAKPSCLRLRNAWVSDRTLCYLASGKPAIVQHTGASRILPDAAGIHRFRSLDEAEKALRQVEAHYEREGRLARELAEERFDAVRGARAVLTAAMGGFSR